MQPQEKTQVKTLLHKGPTIDVILPSMRRITIREQNGGDDDVLSRILAGDRRGDNMLKFLSTITEHDDTIKRKPMPKDIATWGIRDKYYALICSRIHSLGKDLKYEYQCDNLDCISNKPGHRAYGPLKLVEDLSIFLGDFESEDPPKPPACKKYKNGTSNEVNHTLSSGKQVKFQILSSEGENLALEATQEQRTQNHQFIIRKLELLFDGDWNKVGDFQVFSPRDMVELRKLVIEYDEEFMPLSDITCPHCKMQQKVNVLLLPDFFYPLEI